MSETAEFDVAIAGYGPTGQALASLLSQRGHKVVVFERHPGLYGLPRLCALDGEAARIIQNAGDLDLALRVSSWLRKYELEDGSGELITEMDWTDLHMCGFPGRISFYQPDVEDTMDQYAREAGAEINQGWDVLGVRLDGDGVELTAKRRTSEDDGEAAPIERTVRAKYAVGADGANSAVRESLGVKREDFGFRDAFLSIDCRRIGQMPPKLSRGVSMTIADPARNISFIPIGSDRFRLEFLVNPDDDHSALMVPEVGYKMIKDSWDLTPDAVEIYRQVIYPFEGKMASPWRTERAFLAGDAAHLMPPFLGQGACSGLRDAINLAWKLDLVLRGTTSDALLDTYEEERSPQVSILIAGSIALGRVACERDPEAAKQRDEAFRKGEVAPPPDHPTISQGIYLKDSSGELAYLAGHPMEQGIVRYRGETGRLDDLVGGWGFHLLGFEVDPAAHLSAADAEFFASLDGKALHVSTDPTVEDVVLDLDRTYQLYAKDFGDLVAVLYRPDFTIFGVAKSPEEISGLVGALREQLPLLDPAAAPAVA